MPAKINLTLGFLYLCQIACVEGFLKKVPLFVAKPKGHQAFLGDYSKKHRNAHISAGLNTFSGLKVSFLFGGMLKGAIMVVIGKHFTFFLIVV